MPQSYKNPSSQRPCLSNVLCVINLLFCTHRFPPQCGIHLDWFADRSLFFWHWQWAFPNIASIMISRTSPGTTDPRVMADDLKPLRLPEQQIVVSAVNNNANGAVQGGTHWALVAYFRVCCWFLFLCVPFSLCLRGPTYCGFWSFFCM